MIDDKGRIFGKINIIDFLAVTMLLLFIVVAIYGYKQLSKEPPPEPISTHYKINRSCIICGKNREIKILLGKLPPEEFKDRCKKCLNEVFYINPPPPPIQIEENKDYVQLYYEQRYKKLKREERGYAK